MCFNSTKWAIAQKIPAMQKMVLVVLADHENTDTGLCFPSVRLLAEECGMSERSVSNQIARLSAAGLISIERFNHTTNRYILNKPDAPVAKADARRSEPDANRASKPINNQQINQKEFITTAREEILSDFVAEPKPTLTIADLTIEQKECYDWAANHKNYWYTATTSIETFLAVLNKNTQQGLAFQYAEHKKARETWTVNGLNSEDSFNKQSGGNYETRKQFNQPSKLSASDAINEGCQQYLDDWKSRANINNGFTTIM